MSEYVRDGYVGADDVCITDYRHGIIKYKGGAMKWRSIAEEAEDNDNGVLCVECGYVDKKSIKSMMAFNLPGSNWI